MEALLKLQFAEPLPVAMARAKKTAEDLPIHDALKQAGHMLPAGIRSLVQADNSTVADAQQQALTGASSSLSSGTGLGDLHTSAVFDKAMAFMNEQFKIAREKFDIKLFECGFFKLEKEGLLYETQDILDEIAQDISLAEATIEKCNGEIAALSLLLSNKRDELSYHLYVCHLIRTELEKEKAIIEEDLRVIDLIKDTTLEECKDVVKKPFLIQACVTSEGMTDFQTTSDALESHVSQLKTTESQKAYQLMLFEVYGGMGSALPGKLNVGAMADME